MPPYIKANAPSPSRLGTETGLTGLDERPQDMGSIADVAGLRTRYMINADD